jgi:hypothetical protein
MELQYVSDSEGHHTAVIVPIEEWKKISSSHKEQSKTTLTKKKPSEFRGIFSKEEGEKINAYINKARSEWDRNF